MGDQGEVDVSPDHHQFALGEIQYAGGLVDEHEAQRHQGVHASKSDATQARLYQGVQWSGPLGAAGYNSSDMALQPQAVCQLPEIPT